MEEVTKAEQNRVLKEQNLPFGDNEIHNELCTNVTAQISESVSFHADM
jgi:hypothetical protein